MKCIYCGKPAGLFHRSHPECRNLHDAGQQRISDLLQGYLNTGEPADLLGREIREIAEAHLVSDAEVRSLAIAGFERAVNEVLEDHVPSKEEEDKLVRLQREFALTQADVAGAVDKFLKAAILRDLDAGVVEPHVTVEGLSINLLKGELVLWLFNDAELYEMKSHTSYIGGSHGLSLRIARGVYYRVGAFKGHRVQTQDLVREDVGSFIVTNQSVYFEGPMKTIRVRLSKIVSVQGYSDAIELVRESANPKPILIKLDDPWFASNLILKLSAM